MISWKSRTKILFDIRIVCFDICRKVSILNSDGWWRRVVARTWTPRVILMRIHSHMSDAAAHGIKDPLDLFSVGQKERCAYVSRKTHQASRSTHAGIACYSSPKEYTRMLPVAHEQRTRMMFLKSLTDIITLTTHVQIFRTFRRSNRTIFKIFPFVARIPWNQYMYRMYQVLRMYTICNKYKLTASCTMFINNFRKALHY